MDWLFKIFVFLKCKKINEKDINTWLRTKNKALLIFSLHKASFNIRLLSIEALSTFNDVSIIPELLFVAKNDYQKIAFKAIKSIKKLDFTNEYSLEILQIENFWNKKIFHKKHRVITKKSNKKFDKSKMKALENLRQQLRRPISGGKWF